MKELMVCSPKRLPLEAVVAAAKTAIKINPLNHTPLQRLTRVLPEFVATPERIAVLTTKYWGLQGVSLTVGFLDNAPTDLRKRILLHMNAWAKTANVKFVETKSNAQVRIARVAGQSGGYWSYLGTDILHILPKDQTMNLEAFSMDTPESEFHRVVRHETGHTLGFPHEHMRQALVEKIDPQKAIEFFKRTQGWSEEEVRAQVLTPLEESSLRGTSPDPNSIMCYQIPGELTKDGNPIIGGKDIDTSDYGFAAMIYPKKVGAPVSPAKRAHGSRSSR
jgi:Astacin (Peptidase family M12A)